MKVNTVQLTFKISLYTTIIVCLLSCNQNNETLSTDTITVSKSKETIIKDNAPTAEITSTIPNKDLKIIKSATVRYKVKHVKEATNHIKYVTNKYGAYISDLQFENNQYNLENKLTIKIPQQHFDLLMDSIAEVAEFIDFENITTKDVSEEFVDIKTRLKTKQEIKDRYETILRKNAKTVKDILATEEKLSTIQEEI